MKRKKYAEELEARLSDEDVKVIVKAKKTNAPASKGPGVQLFVVRSFSFYSNIFLEFTVCVKNKSYIFFFTVFPGKSQ